VACVIARDVQTASSFSREPPLEQNGSHSCKKFVANETTIWKPKSMLSQAIGQESPEHVQETARRDIFLRLLEQYEAALRRLAGGYADREADREEPVPGHRGRGVASDSKIPRRRSERTWLYRIAYNIAISSSVRLRG
jgi:hypothetical protein